MSGSTRVVQAAKWIAACTLLSRVTGLVRDALLAQAFGLGWVQDSWKYAFQIPNLFRRLFGEGGLAPVFVPTFSQTLDHEGKAAARRLLARSFTLLSVALLVVLLVLEAGILLLWLGSVGGAATGENASKWELPLLLTGLMLPFMVTICLLALFSAVLNCTGSFVPAALAPVLLNIALIVGIVALGPLAARLWLSSAEAPAGTPAEVGAPAADPHAETGAARAQREQSSVSAADRARVITLALTVVAAGLLQLAFVWPFLRRRELQPALAWAPRDPAVQRMLRLMPPVALSQGVLAFGVFFDAQLCLLLSQKAGAASTAAWLGVEFQYPLREGALSALAMAQTLYQFPLGVLVISLATAALPEFSRLAGRGDWSGWTAQVRQTLRLAVFEGLLAGTMMIVLAEPIVRLLFEYGRFDAADTARTAAVLRWYGLGLWAFCAQHMLQRAFYSLNDARTPLRISLAVLPANILLAFGLVWIPGVGESAFAIASILSYAAAVFIGARLLSRRSAGGPMLLSSDGLALLRMLGVGVLTGGVVALLQPYWPEQRLIAALGPLCFGTALFLALAWLARLPEAALLLRLIRRRQTAG